MEKEFVPYELAVKLKALGFDEECFGLWNINNGKYQVDVIGTCKYSENFKYREVLAPTFSQAFRWFRDKYKQSHIWMMDELLDTGEYTYEEAELDCLTKLIEIVESKSE